MTTELIARSSLGGRLVARADLSAKQIDEMYALLCAHFEGVRRDVFESDLADKNWVILLEDARLGLAGFSTLRVYETNYPTVDGPSPVSVVYSGDTIVTPEAWGSSALPRTWIASVNTLRRQFPNGPLYWLLITSGFRTYRFLPLFWREFFPRHDATTPPQMQAILNHLARERFGNQFDSAAGVVRFTRPQVLRDHLRGISDERLRNPHVAFFAQRNPGHINGDELVCITELGPDNLTSAGRRMANG